ncbi:MAG TPA: hypothetical protein VGB17_09440 [Pyrinomonadaceae bacterium]
MEKVLFFNLPDCYRLFNETVELIVTTNVGPRILRYGFVGADNLLGLHAEAAVKTALGEFKPWGGHRLWAAPEANPRSYAPDNLPVEYELDGDRRIRLTAQPEEATGIQKELTVTLDPAGTGVTVHHRITNRNLWTIELAPWALTIMNGGGEAILPQEPYRSWDECLLPARPLVLWHYTDLSDTRWTLGKKFIRLRTDAQKASPQKIGIANKQGWAAYLRAETLFVKRFDYLEGASYPDYGSNNEIYTASSFIELESLAPLQQLEPGQTAEHTERWHLFANVQKGDSEETLDAALSTLIAQTAATSYLD